jgi:two-component system, probable response regulator PhcQ
MAEEGDMMRKILLVDDEANVLSALQRALRQHLPASEVTIEPYSDPLPALTRCCEIDFDVVISDFRMPEMNGVEFLHTLKEVAPLTVRMILSASTEFETVSSAIAEAQVFRYIPKPWLIEDLLRDINAAFAFHDEALREHELAMQQKRLQEQLSPEDEEARRLEEEEPGLLKVKWGPNGEIIL